MNPTDTVLISVVVIVGTTILKHIHEGKGGVLSPIVFGFLLATALLLIAVFAPRIAIALAYLGLVGAFAVNGPAVFTLMGNFGRDQKK